ncbi:MAG: hypothetical protein R2687_04340 [Candidatus Nanopelagicales bacterium]
MSSWWDAAASALLGSTCVGCERPGRPWCSACGTAFAESVDPLLAAGDPPLIVGCRYEGCIPEAIVGYKDRGISSLRPLLGHVLAAGVLQAADLLDLPPQSTLVPAATSAVGVRRRGFDHMWDLARTASVVTDLPARRLLRAGTRADQARLSFAARRRNLRSTMRVARAGDGPVIVVDDVRTSGATLAECDRALSEGGYEVVAHVVIAGSINDPTCTQDP